MSKVAIVIDSTITLPEDIIRQYQLHVVPQVLIWGEQTYLDQIDIQTEEFYTRLAVDKVHPSTSQVSPASFQKVFEELTGQGFDIISILVSGKLSGTIASALQAQAALPGKNIAIVDSQFTSLASGFLALSVARAAQQGASLEECVQLANKGIEHIGVFFCLETLKFLHKGGRIGGAAALVGTALDLKPILEIRDGRIEAAGKVRTKSKASDKMLELLDEKIAGRSPLRLAILHAQARNEAEALMDKLLLKYRLEEHYLCEISPVLGVHTGPGTIGVAFMAGM